MYCARGVAVEVREVSSGRDLKRFIDLPFRLHANHPLWVPPLKLERRLFLNRRLNAFFSHGEAEYLLALRDGRVVGRTSAQINHAFNDYQQKRWGWFGFFELEDDAQVAHALYPVRPALRHLVGCDPGASGAGYRVRHADDVPDAARHRGIEHAGR